MVFLVVFLSAADIHSRAKVSFPQKIFVPPDTLEEGFLSDESFTIGSGVSFFIDNTGNSRRSLIGYYGTVSAEKKFFGNFLISAGIDGYTIPKSDTKLIGNINMNVIYGIPLGDRITIGLMSGLFTGFIQRKNSSGINSGGLVGMTIRYKINKKYETGVVFKYPFFTESKGIVLTNVFFSF